MRKRLRDFIERAATEQSVSDHEPLREEVLQSYSALIGFNRELFFKCPIDAIETEIPFFYKDANEMFAAIERNVYHVWNADTFPTLHPYAFRDFGIYRNQKNFLTSRIVHDYFGHYKNRIGFGTLNELRVAALTLHDLPEKARKAHLCEFVTQICFFEKYGNYPEQKAFLVSDELLQEWIELASDELFRLHSE